MAGVRGRSRCLWGGAIRCGEISEGCGWNALFILPAGRRMDGEFGREGTFPDIDERI